MTVPRPDCLRETPGRTRLFPSLSLRTRRGERIPPEVVDVLNVLVVGADALHQRVVVAVRIGPERLVAFQHDHRGTVGVELLEDFANSLERLQRWRIGRAQPHVVGFADDLELRDENVRDRGEGQPYQQDRQC